MSWNSLVNKIEFLFYQRSAFLLHLAHGLLLVLLLHEVLLGLHQVIALLLQTYHSSPSSPILFYFILYYIILYYYIILLLWINFFFFFFLEYIFLLIQNFFYLYKMTQFFVAKISPKIQYFIYYFQFFWYQ